MELIDFICKTALHIAIEKGNIKIVQFLLAMPNIDINIKTIFNANICFIIF